MPTTTRERLTVAQAALPAFVSTCALCGSRAIFLVETDRPAVEHRCATAVVGAVWTLVERPARTAEQSAAALLNFGVQTVEQARAALLAAPAAEHATEAGLEFLPAAV